MISSIIIYACAFVLGIVLSEVLGITSVIFFALCMLISYTSYVIIFKKFNRTLLIAVVLVIFGAVRFGFASQDYLNNNYLDKYVTVNGTIASIPSQSHGNYPNKYILDADTVTYKGESHKLHRKILINTDASLVFGENISVSGFVSKTAERRNESEFDYSAYYKSLGIFSRITAFETQAHEISVRYLIQHPFGTLKYILFTKIVMTDNSDFLSAILLNDKTRFSDEYKSLIIRTGLIHSLYSSYVHMLIMCILAAYISRKKGKNYRESVMVALCTIYALFNMNSPVILKAAVLSILIRISKRIFGYSDKLDALSFLLLVMTLIDPLLCFNSGFVLSVFTTVLMYFSYEPIRDKIWNIFKSFNPIITSIINVVSVWFILSVGTMPICALYFNGISVYSSLITLILLPFIVLVLTLSPCFLLLGFGDRIISAILYPLRITPFVIEKLPFYYLTIQKPDAWFIIFFYLAWILLLCRVTLNTDFIKPIVAVLCGIMAFVLVEVFSDNLDIYFVNVGQGDGAVMHTSAGDTVLIDGGGSSEQQQSYNIGEQVYLPYLISKGFTNIDVAILSHCHKDHAEGIIAACENLRVNTLVMPDAMKDSPYRIALDEIAKRRNIKIEYLKKGDIIKFNSGLTLTVLAPDTKQLLGSDENDTSLVISVDYGNFSALFTGDSSDEADASYPKDVDILKVAHHGSLTANSENFINSTNPDYAVISVGENNSYGLPNRDVLARLKSSNAEILRTDFLGDIHFSISKNGFLNYNSFR